MSFDDRLYVIDTCAILDWLRRYYPKDVFPVLWHKLNSLITSRRMISPYEVFKEIEIGDDWILEWANQHKYMFLSPSANEQKYVSTIIIGNKIKAPKRKRSGLWADPWVVALAWDRQAIVVTGEQPAGSSPPSKIPDMCRILGIECTDLLGMMRREKWTF